MKETYFESANKYYTDDLGTIEDQIAFLDSYSEILNPVLCFSLETMSQLLSFTGVKVTSDKIRCSEVFLVAGKTHCSFCFWPYTIDIDSYLRGRGFKRNFVTQTYQKNLSLCEEEVSEVVEDTAVVEDAASVSPTEGLECGN